MALDRVDPPPATPNGVARLIDRALGNPALFHLTRIPTYLGTMPHIRAALAMAEGERLLDVGCGTGLCASATRGLYVGIDTWAPYLRFGRRRGARRNRHFLAMSVYQLGLADRSFDKALVVNMVHHLDAAAIDALLGELCRVVSRRVVLLDAAPDIANPIERLLLDHDRGAHIRSRPELRALLDRHFEIEREAVFHNALRTAPQVLFQLTPKPSLVASR